MSTETIPIVTLTPADKKNQDISFQNKFKDYKEFCEKIAPPGVLTEEYYPHEKKFKQKFPTQNFLDTPFAKIIPKDYSVFDSKLNKFFTTYRPNIRPFSKLEAPTNIFLGSFVIGEAHRNISPKRFICEYADHLQKMRYKFCGMEHLFFDKHQASLDSFHDTGIMPDDLKEKLEELDECFGWGHFVGPEREKTSAAWKANNFTAVTEALQKAGIRIIALDISYIYEFQDDERRPNNRIREMNYTAFHILQHIIWISGKVSDKWFALMGNGHTVLNNGIPGLAELMGARALLFVDRSTITKTTLQYHTNIEVHNVEKIHKKGSAILEADILIESNPLSSLEGVIPVLSDDAEIKEKSPPPLETHTKKDEKRQTESYFPDFEKSNEENDTPIYSSRVRNFFFKTGNFLSKTRKGNLVTFAGIEGLSVLIVYFIADQIDQANNSTAAVEAVNEFMLGKFDEISSIKKVCSTGVAAYLGAFLLCALVLYGCHKWKTKNPEQEEETSIITGVVDETDQVRREI